MSIDTTKVKSYLTEVFKQVLSEDEVTNHRARAFATIANYTSKASGLKVSEVLSNDEIGEICNNIRDSYINARIERVAAKVVTERGGF